MARQKSTLVPSLVQVMFIRREPAPTGGYYYHFQAPDYIQEYNRVLTPEECLSEIDDFDSHIGNVKIKVNDKAASSKAYSHLLELRQGKLYGLFLASNPQSITNEKGQISAVYEQQVIRAVVDLPDRLWEQLDDWMNRARRGLNKTSSIEAMERELVESNHG